MGQIDAVVSEELFKAKIPNASISIIQGNEVKYLSYPDGGSGFAVDEYTLYQIGSVSKSFTGLGILLLEDNDLLSLDDPVNKYLPWFTVSHNRKAVSSDVLTIADCLYQTSGFTNDEARYPSAKHGMSLEDSVRQINKCELAFYPHERFSYANANYRILGLIIETISGQNYDNFMTERILLPLGLENTYTSPLKAQNTGKVTEGSRLSFLRAWPYDVPADDGNVPSGYIYSNAKDMSRWLQIHLGVIEISEQFHRIIEKSHQPDPQSIIDDTTRYTAGWYANAKTGAIYHSGGTPNYSANVEIRPAANSAVCVLTNMNASANTNHIAANILDVLEGKPASAYQTDIWYIFDMVFSLITAASIIGFIIYTFVILRIIRQTRKGKCIKKDFTRKDLKCFIFPSILALFSVLIAVIPPLIFGSPWTTIRKWSPVSLSLGIASLIAFSICAFFFSFVVANYKKE
jgi:CubicO group peptidase (beta-lactamase class C family)